MTHQTLAAARTSAELDTLIAALKGKALTEALLAAGLRASGTVEQRRLHLAWFHNARRNSVALSR
jgi:hypothetical protein